MTISAKSATDLKPMSDRVVVRPATEDEMTVGGIILPDTARQRPQKGEVVAVGPGRVLNSGARVEIEVSPETRLSIPSTPARRSRSEDEELLVLGSNDILAKIA